MPSQVDPDTLLVVLFRNRAQINENKTRLAGRPIYDDTEEVEIRAPGSKNTSVHPVWEVSHWETDPHTGRQFQVTYAERFKRQYDQFKAHAVQTASGTPLSLAPFLTEARRAELRALNIYTIEALAAVDGQELKNLGHGGREMKNQAEEFIAVAATRAPDMQIKAELESMKARLAVLQEDNEMLKRNQPVSGEAMFDEMTNDQLKDYIATHTGVAPVGALGRKTLLRSAMDAKPTKAA
jgi:hypothetical protein